MTSSRTGSMRRRWAERRTTPDTGSSTTLKWKTGGDKRTKYSNFQKTSRKAWPSPQADIARKPRLGEKYLLGPRGRKHVRHVVTERHSYNLVHGFLHNNGNAAQARCRRVQWCTKTENISKGSSRLEPAPTPPKRGNITALKETCLQVGLFGDFKACQISLAKPNAQIDRLLFVFPEHGQKSLVAVARCQESVRRYPSKVLVCLRGTFVCRVFRGRAVKRCIVTTQSSVAEKPCVRREDHCNPAGSTEVANFLQASPISPVHNINSVVTLSRLSLSDDEQREFMRL